MNNLKLYYVRGRSQDFSLFQVTGSAPVTHIPFYVIMIKTKINILHRKGRERKEKPMKNLNNSGPILIPKGAQKKSASKKEATERFADEINYHIRNMVERTIAMGNILIEAREKVINRDEWLKFLHKAEMSEDLAESHMNVAQKYPDPKVLSASEISEAFKLITYTS